MATTVSWFTGDLVESIDPAESGTFDTAGYYGAGFGLSIRVGEYNDTTYVVNDDGTSSKPGQPAGGGPNTKYAGTATGVFIPSNVNPVLLTDLAQAEATLAIRLTTDSPVSTQNASFRCFDRVSIDNGPSGVLCRAAEVIRNPADSPPGSGDSTWISIAGATSLALDDQTLNLTTHTYYVAVTVSPQSIGEKTSIGFYWESEFL